MADTASRSESGSHSGSEVEFLEDEDGEPTEEQVVEYAEFLGMDLKTEMHLLWIAREGVAAPVPKPWKTCTEKGEVFYFNFETEESSWDHPCDAHYRALLEEHRKGVGTSKVEEPAITTSEVKGSNSKNPKHDEEGSESFISEMVESEVEEAPLEAKETSEASSPWSVTSTPDPARRVAGPSEGKTSESAQSGGLSGDVPTHSGAKIESSRTNSKDARLESSHEADPPDRGIDPGNNAEAITADKELSEVSEDFRSDWGAPSPLGSSAPGGGLLNVAAPHSLEVSASDAGSVLGPLTPQAAPVKSWIMLKEESNRLMQVIRAVEELRLEQARSLQRLKCH